MQLQFSFRELFVEKHENVSILFSDICNFTPLTTTLPVDKLVETLNDLFGKFDDAADVRDFILLRILHMSKNLRVPIFSPLI